MGSGRKRQISDPLERDVDSIRLRGLERLSSARNLTFEVIEELAWFQAKIEELAAQNPAVGVEARKARAAKALFAEAFDLMGTGRVGRAAKALYGAKGAEPPEQAVSEYRGKRKMTDLLRRELGAAFVYGIGYDQFRQEVEPDIRCEVASAILELDHAHRRASINSAEERVGVSKKASASGARRPEPPGATQVASIPDAEIRRVVAPVPTELVDAYFSIQFRLEPAGGSPRHLAATLARITGQGDHVAPSWSKADRPTLASDLRVSDRYIHVEISYPLAALGGRPSIPALLGLSWIAAEYSATRAVWIEDIRLPVTALEQLSGPRLGAAGLRDLLGVNGRPILAAIVKPRYGGDLMAFTHAAEEALRGGADGLVDDELLVDPEDEFAFDSRIDTLTSLVSRISAATGESKFYIPNVTGRLSSSESMVRKAVAQSLNVVIANPITMGYAAFEDLVDLAAELNCAVIDCGIGSGMLSLPGNAAGTATTLFSKFGRWIGADAFHSGSQGEHWYTPTALQSIIANLTGPMGKMKPTLPVVAGGVNAGSVWQKLAPFGNDCMANAGTGIWSHPAGPAAGAESVRLILGGVSMDTPRAEADEQIRLVAGEEQAVAEALSHFGLPPSSSDLGGEFDA